MQQIVPLQPVPSQTLQIVLNGQSCNLSVYSLDAPSSGITGDTSLITADTTLLTADSDVPPQDSGTNVYVDLFSDGIAIVTARLARNLQKLVAPAGYNGFLGELYFVDTQNVGLQAGTDPMWGSLGSQYQLVYDDAA